MVLPYGRYGDGDVANAPPPLYFPEGLAGYAVAYNVGLQGWVAPVAVLTGTPTVTAEVASRGVVEAFTTMYIGT